MEGTGTALDVGRFVTVKEAAAYLRVTERQVYALLAGAAPVLKSTRPQGMKRRLIERAHLEAYATGAPKPDAAPKEPGT